LTALFPGREVVEVSVEPYPDEAGVSPFREAIRFPGGSIQLKREIPCQMASTGPGEVKALPSSERANPGPRILLRSPGGDSSPYANAMEGVVPHGGLDD